MCVDSPSAEKHVSMIILFSGTLPVVMRGVLGCVEARLHAATSWNAPHIVPCSGGKWVRNGDEPLAEWEIQSGPTAVKTVCWSSLLLQIYASMMTGIAG